MNASRKISDFKNHWLKGWIPFWLVSMAVTIGAVLPPKHIPIFLTAMNDKLIHFVEYFVLWLASHYSFRKAKTPGLRNRSASNALDYCVFMGVLTECLQFFAPGRSPQFSDWVADVFGALIAYLLVTFRRASVKKKASP